MSFAKALLLALPCCFSTPGVAATPGGCLSAQEYKLVRLINAYRDSQGLPAVSVSKSMTSVAQWHTIDLFENNPGSGSENGLACNNHSWSGANDRWNPVCYTGDHANAQGMWSKPREVTTVYTGNGYENVYWLSSAGQVLAQAAFDGWKYSLPHRETMLEQGIWEGIHWQAMGVGIYKNYATLWFGQAVDPAGTVGVCSDARGGSSSGLSMLPSIFKLLLE